MFTAYINIYPKISKIDNILLEGTKWNNTDDSGQFKFYKK